ncbi:MAG: leucyl aminopeptidase [Patescibacteria group bacterium]
MEINLLKDIRTANGAVPVIILAEGEDLKNHSFASFFSTDDLRYIAAFFKKTPVRDGHTHLLFTPSGREAVVAGIQKRTQFSHRKALSTARRIVAFARRERIKHIAVSLHDFVSRGFDSRLPDLAEVIATQFELANFEYTEYRTKPAEGWQHVHAISVYAKRAPKAVAEGLRRGKIVGEETNAMRELSNTPGGDLVPAGLAGAAVKAGKAFGFSVKVLSVSDMEKLGMGGVLGVGRGSDHPPKFIVMEYLKGKKNEQPVVLVGKGVTFDTGGLNLKPEQGIYEMHMDMSGGASVIHIVAALARLKVKKNIVALVPAVENMPSGRSYHPGDVLRTMSGKTIEILNTDAEGRVILADGLTYAKRYNPRAIIDVATLTGAAMVALGARASALFATDLKLERRLREIGEETGDFVWPLPLWEEYEQDIKGTFGDVANSSKVRYGGAITAAMFLWQFVKDSSVTSDKRQGTRTNQQQVSWIHLDIAPRMTSTEGDYLAKGSAGASVPLLVRFLTGF